MECEFEGCQKEAVLIKTLNGREHIFCVRCYEVVERTFADLVIDAPPPQNPDWNQDLGSAG